MSPWSGSPWLASPWLAVVLVDAAFVDPALFDVALVGCRLGGCRLVPTLPPSSLRRRVASLAWPCPSCLRRRSGLSTRTWPSVWLTCRALLRSRPRCGPLATDLGAVTALEATALEAADFGLDARAALTQRSGPRSQGCSTLPVIACSPPIRVHPSHEGGRPYQLPATANPQQPGRPLSSPRARLCPAGSSCDPLTGALRTIADS